MCSRKISKNYNILPSVPTYINYLLMNTFITTCSLALTGHCRSIGGYYPQLLSFTMNFKMKYHEVRIVNSNELVCAPNNPNFLIRE